jgi:hypothetical protein
MRGFHKLAIRRRALKIPLQKHTSGRLNLQQITKGTIHL